MSLTNIIRIGDMVSHDRLTISDKGTGFSYSELTYQPVTNEPHINLVVLRNINCISLCPFGQVTFKNYGDIHNV